MLWLSQLQNDWSFIVVTVSDFIKIWQKFNDGGELPGDSYYQGQPTRNMLFAIVSWFGLLGRGLLYLDFQDLVVRMWIVRVVLFGGLRGGVRGGLLVTVARQTGCSGLGSSCQEFARKRSLYCCCYGWSGVGLFTLIVLLQGPLVPPTQSPVSQRPCCRMQQRTHLLY